MIEKYVVCDHCHKIIRGIEQAHFIDMQFTRSVNTQYNKDYSYHLCPDCSTLFEDFVTNWMKPQTPLYLQNDEYREINSFWLKPYDTKNIEG